MKKLFAMAALAAAAVSVNAEVTPRSPIVPWGAQAEIIITNDLTQQNSDGSWSLTADAQQWMTTTYDGEESTLVQQTNRNSVWFDIYDEATDTMIVTSAEKNWGGQIAVTSKTGAATGLIVVGKNRYPHFFVTGTDKAKFYFYGSAGTAGYARIEVFEVGATEPVMTLQGTKAQTKKTWSDGELLIAEGLDKAKSYEFVARTMALDAETGEYTYEGGDMVLQVVKLYGDQAPMREDGVIISGSEIGSYINQHLAAYPDVTDFTLEGNGRYTIAEGIVAAGKFTLTGVASAPATIDASALEAPFVKFEGGTEYAQKPVVDAETGETTYENSAFFDVPEVTIANVKITSLAQSLINDAQKSLFTAINITNDNIEIVGSNAIFALGNGYPTNLTISKSTLWSAEGHKGFLFQAQGRPAKDFADDATATFSIENSTLFQIGVGKKINNNNSGLKGQTCLHLNLTKSILVNTGSSTGNEINGWLFGQNSTNPTVTYDQNTYWTLGTTEVTDEETGETSTELVSEIVPGWTDAEKQGSDQTETQLTTAPFTLANAAAGNFTVGASSAQAKYMTGDPRWLVPYATDAIKIEVDQSENTDFVAVLNAALETSEAPSSIEISFWEAGEYPTTGEINTTSPIRFLNGSDINAGEATIVVKNGMTLGGQIEFNGVNIDATGLEAPVITLGANEYKLQDNGFYNLGSIQFKNMSAKGLAQQLVYGNKIKNQISELLVENSNVDVTGCTKVPFDFNGGGAIGAFNIKKSTIWAAEPTSQSLFSTQSGNKAIDAGFTTQNIAIDNSTLYNIAKSKNFYTHRQSNQTWLAYYLRNNIFVNVGKSGQVVKGINQGASGKNPKWTVSGNAFFFDDGEGGLKDTSADESTGDTDEPVLNSLSGKFAFNSVETPDFGGTFTLNYGSHENENLRAPRWTIDFEKVFEDFYGIVGEITGSWEEDLELTTTSEWGVLEATVENVNVPAVKDFKYKLRANKSWDGYQLPKDGDNIWTPDTVGMYKVTFTADVLNHTLTATAERTGDAVEEEAVYTVAGAYKVGENEEASFFGEAWNQALEANDMTLGEDGIYTLTFSNVRLTSTGTIFYKVVKNHSWVTNWGFNGNNADYVINENGLYDITFYFNPETALDNGFNVSCNAVNKVIKGDANYDGEVGIGDIVAITNVMAGIETDETVKTRANVNGDAEVGIGDIVAITNIMAGTPAATEPEPEAGE